MRRSRFQGKLIPQIQLPARKARVVVVEKNPIIATALKESLSHHSIAAVFSGGKDFGQALMIPQGSVPVFIIDEDCCSASIYQYLKILSDRLPESKRLILGEEFSTEQIFSLLLEGAHGFVRYNYVRKELDQSIDAVLGGRLWVHSSTLEQVCLYMQKVWHSSNQHCFKFTQRQKQVLDLVQRKMSNKQIASQLSISENTVKFHLGKIFCKVGTRTRESIHEVLSFTGT
jgi:DNA-binding NarL/FixJ family response regulator